MLAQVRTLPGAHRGCLMFFFRTDAIAATSRPSRFHRVRAKSCSRACPPAEKSALLRVRLMSGPSQRVTALALGATERRDTVATQRAG